MWRYPSGPELELDERMVELRGKVVIGSSAVTGWFMCAACHWTTNWAQSGMPDWSWKTSTHLKSEGFEA